LQQFSAFSRLPDLMKEKTKAVMTNWQLFISIILYTCIFQ
jgi:hypothetical protein